MTKFEWSQIKRMAEEYRKLHELPIHRAVYKANEAFEIFKDSEYRVMDTYYEGE